MVRVRVLALMAVVGMFAGPMSSAYAGGMGLGNNVAFHCYLATGDGPGGTMDLVDRFGDTKSLKVGGVKLYCTDAFSDPNNPFTGLRNGTPPPPCDTAGNGACDLKCYDLRSAKGTNSASLPLLVSDFFFNEEPTSIGTSQVLCVGAQGTTPPAPAP